MPSFYFSCCRVFFCVCCIVIIVLAYFFSLCCCHDHEECHCHIFLLASCSYFIILYCAIFVCLPCSSHFVICYRFWMCLLSFIIALHHDHHALVCIFKSSCVKPPSSSYLHLIHATCTYQQPFVKFTQVSIPSKLLLSSLLHLFSCDISLSIKMFLFSYESCTLPLTPL